MTTPLSSLIPSFQSGPYRSVPMVDAPDPGIATDGRAQPVLAGALYLVEDPVQRSICWQKLWLDQKLASLDDRAALLVALAEAIGSLPTLSERTQAMTHMQGELPGLLPPQKVELVAALAEQIEAQPATAFRKAVFDDLNTVVTQFEERFRHAAYVHVLAKIARTDGDTVDHVFGEILRCTGNFAGASGAALVQRLAATIPRLPAARRLPRFASLASVLRHAFIPQLAVLDVALLGTVASINDPLERACAFSTAVSTLARLPEQQRRLAGSAVTRAFAALAAHLKPAAFNELLMLAALGSAPRRVERLLELIPLTAALTFHQTATVFSWMEALTAACPQREQARIYAGFFCYTNSILDQRARQTLRRWIQCRLSRLSAEGQTFFADAVLDDSLAILSRLRTSVEQDRWLLEQQHRFDALVDLMPALPPPCRIGFANAMCNLIWAAQRAGRPYSRALWDSFAPNLTPESQSLMSHRLGFSVDASTTR